MSRARPGSAIGAAPGLELRPVGPEEQRAYASLLRRAFGMALPTEEELALTRDTTEFDRTLAFFDGAEIIATAGIFSYRMTVPGGSLACAGVTRVGVLSTHRRRGLLTAMMRRQLDDMHERGEPLAALYASEAPIYGRFGYGLATYQAELEIDRSRGSFVNPPPAGGRLRLMDVPAAVDAFTSVWEEALRDQPGMLSLDRRWWRMQLSDLESSGRDRSPKYRVLYEADGVPRGFVVYRINMGWDATGPIGTVHIEFLIATTKESYAALWRYVLDVDLIVKVSAPMRPVEEPLRFLLADPRQPKLMVEDGIWLRLVDVTSALQGRRYAVEGSLTLEVRDRVCAWNAGRFQLTADATGAECRPTRADPDLALDVADLAAAYLGGTRFRLLHQAGRVRELSAGAVAQADAMFMTDRAPWCPSHF
ncbi:MAG: GNAT family N-acetyltransferase [Candidatus Dormibacteraeota bacterium]|nr:GNAT family N-acetyltransferase [Candidatus Dormibacteraeota bacterium]